MYQVIGDILKGNGLNDIIKLIKDGKFGWDHNCFNEQRMKLEEQNDFIENPFEIEEGVIECRCGNKKVFSYSKQVRSSDEPMTTYAHCPICDSKWTYSG